jgi:hypothetical protein
MNGLICLGQIGDAESVRIALIGLIGRHDLLETGHAGLNPTPRNPSSFEPKFFTLLHAKKKCVA